MDISAVEAWLSSYGRAWEQRRAAEFVRLFSPDVRYHWTPFEPPKEGHAALQRAVEAAIGTQQDISFEARVLAHTANSTLAHWSCSFTRAGSGKRVRLDGIFLMEFALDGSCRVFREWWHSDEEPGDRPATSRTPAAG